MALRRLASEVACRTGVQFAAPAWAAPAAVSQGFGASCLRAYATVVDGLKYAKSHEWAKPEGDTATVGISDFAQQALGDVVYVELPEVGSEVTKGETFGVVESVKAASDVYAPISGEVVAVNNDLVEDSGKVNSDPFGAGWMMKVRMTDAGELDSLMDAKAYEAQCEKDDH